MASEFDPPGDEASPWSSRGFIISAGVLGVIVALAVLLVVSNLLGGSPQPVPPAADGDALVTGQPADPAAGESDSVCGLPDVQLTGTVNAPPTAEWTLLGTIAVPQRGGVGPGVIEEDDFRYCYAHTPEGALFMAANLVGMGGTARLSQRVDEYAPAAGPGREAAIKDGAGDSSSSSDGSGIRIQVAGFRILSYSGDRASVDLAFRISNGATAAQSFELVWEDGDWKVQLTDAGQMPSDFAQVPDLSGYIQWGGA